MGILRDKIKPMYWLKGLVLSFMITIVLITIMSLLLRFTDLREGKLPLLNNIIMLMSIALSSMYMAIKVREKGWLNGAALGFGYYLIIILINFVVLKSVPLNMVTAVKLMMSVLIGSIGGMIGINLI